MKFTPVLRHITVELLYKHQEDSTACTLAGVMTSNRNSVREKKKIEIIFFSFPHSPLELETLFDLDVAGHTVFPLNRLFVRIWRACENGFIGIKRIPLQGAVNDRYKSLRPP
ncbi:hypothetical protein EVAR_59769_1 [Eumeta japonica]|uniref:Uncharacterized protein n=1 Tax=Eumeta variegata TaxID=151549 RepID=A0A4C1ZI55_EUMVA|nr:hypothetical protein EVAR_59769_1 [Eumeta japonica]